MKAHDCGRIALATVGLALPHLGRAQVPSYPSAPGPPTADNQNPSFVHNLERDLVQERVNLGACKGGIKGAPGCAETLFTGTPFHISVTSLAPQNGVAAGLAFAEVYHPTYCTHWLDLTKAPSQGLRNACHWSLNMNAEAVASGNRSWRAGLYVTAARISSHTPVVGRGGGRSRGLCHVQHQLNRPSATVSFYSEGNSLNRLYFYGLGPSSAASGQSSFGLTENVTGLNAVLPVGSTWLQDCGLSMLGELNGRFSSVRGTDNTSTPSIETKYTEATAPGLSTSPGFLQVGEGLRFIPPLPAASHVKLNYLVNFQQFLAPSASSYSFRRFTADLNHRLVLYSRDVGKPARVAPPPVPGMPAQSFPPISPTRDVTGSITARLFIQSSIANAGHTVPFFFDPTLGGSDINGQSILASYPDYRFRAPNLLLIHGAFEHSLGKVPIGVFLGVDEAKVGLYRDDISFDHLRHTYSAGLTVHAGGLPVLYLLFAWGGNEGHHTIANINTALIGSNSRPSLF